MLFDELFDGKWDMAFNDGENAVPLVVELTVESIVRHDI
jgi:hypothetical protein